MIPIPPQIPIGAEWLQACPRANGFGPGGGQPVQEVLWRGNPPQQVVEWSYAVIQPIHLGTGTAPNAAIRNWVQQVVGYPDDDAGHIVANQLGGSGTVTWNIFPQSGNFNKGVYNHDVEGILRNVQQRGLTTYAWYNFEFNDTAKPVRATQFRFLLLLSDGTAISNDLLNPH